MSYRVLVVDDEPLARQRLKRLLDEHKDFACIAEAGDGQAAVDWLSQFRADLVLLDLAAVEASRWEVRLEMVDLGGLVRQSGHDGPGRLESPPLGPRHGRARGRRRRTAREPPPRALPPHGGGHV